jgi:hypothetical protein
VKHCAVSVEDVCEYCLVIHTKFNVIMIGSNRLPGTSVGWMCLDDELPSVEVAWY